jgi:hypothetical protein
MAFFLQKISIKHVTTNTSINRIIQDILRAQFLLAPTRTRSQSQLILYATRYWSHLSFFLFLNIVNWRHGHIFRYRFWLVACTCADRVQSQTQRNKTTRSAGNPRLIII